MHGCNCHGVMGSGIAKAIRDKWPQVFIPYATECNMYPFDQRDQLLGKIKFVDITPELIIANAFTQVKYGYDKGRYADPVAIKKALFQVVDIIRLFYPDLPLYMPKIGCGLGGLSWDIDVKPIVEEVHDKMSSSEMFPTIKPINIIVCEL